jgi:nucleolar protein 9
MTSCDYYVDVSKEYAAASREYAAPPNRELQDHHPKKHPQKSRNEVASNPLEPTTTGALLLQSLLRLDAPHNALVLDRCAHGRRPGAF